MRRLRAIEERCDLIEGRLDNLQNTVLKSNEKEEERFKALSAEIKSLQENFLKIESNLIKVAKGMENTAKDSDLKHLQNLVELYSPFKKKAGSNE